MNKEKIMAELESLGSIQTKKTFLNHGAKEPLFGVKVGDLKPIQKKIKKDYQLALELFATGNSDAQYLAGLIADEKKMTKKDLSSWAKQASWSMIIEYTVPWIAAESAHGVELGLEWINKKDEKFQSMGWSTLSSVVSIMPDEELDLKLLSKLMKQVKSEIHSATNRVRYTMNNFLIAVGCYVPALNKEALLIASEIGSVAVNMGATACKVPDAVDYINKVVSMGRLGKKKKMARC